MTLLSSTLRGRMLRATPAALAAAGLCAAVPATSHAAFQTFGSDLTAPANVTQAHQADTAYWQTAVANPAMSPVSPAGGQVVEVRIKGIAPRSTVPTPAGADPLAGSPLFHFQVLEPVVADGRQTVRALRASAGFEIPTAGDPQQITVYRPENLCIDQGQYVAFNEIGGYDGIANRNPKDGPVGPYPDGTVFQIFSSAPGASTDWFEAHGKWVDPATSGTPFVPRPGSVDRGGRLQGTELLMQMVVATGPDAFYMCPGGTNNPYRPPDPPRAPKAPKPVPIQKSTFPAGQRVNVKRNGQASLALFCQPGPKRCTGQVTIYSKLGLKSVGRHRRARVTQLAKLAAIGTARFDVGAKSTGGVRVRLTRKGHRLFLARNKKLPVTIVAVTDPGGSDHTDSYKVTLKKVGSR